MDGYRIWKAALLLLVILAMLAATACEPTVGGGATQVWIDVPLDRAQVDASKVGWIGVQSHAASRNGIARLDLRVNGQPYRSDNNPTPNEPLIHVTQPWRPLAAGTYVLEVQAVSNDGQASQPDRVTVVVVGAAPPTEAPSEAPTEAPTEVPTEAPTEEGPTFTPTPCPTGYAPAQGKCVPIITPTFTPTPTGTPTPTDTPTPTLTPTPTGTPKPPTPTYTPQPPTATFTPPPPPPADIQFLAGEDNIKAGSCTKVTWHVANVKAYWVDGKPGSGDDGGFETCPCQDETHTLHVVKADGSEQDFYVTIHVSGECAPPEDTTPPTVPSPLKPSGAVRCTSMVTLVWSEASDASGIAVYAVKLQRDDGKTSGWESKTNSVQVPVECGHDYLWRVRAQDNAGNWSDWSGEGKFGVYK
jgi:hypothetical protein